ncbi:MAG: 4'-phosphopantetheinyl transferase superfamily protein, partial [Chitinophagales bacterium]
MKIFYIHHPLQLDSQTFNRLLRQIPFELQEKIKRYRRWKDQQAGLWGKLLLMKSLEEMGLEKNSLQHLQYTSYQRPYFPEHLGFGIDFNISHSGFAVACVVSQQQRIGIDIEQVRPIEIKHFTEQFSPAEMQQMYDTADTQRAFFERWCQKEAIIKVDGRG